MTVRITGGRLVRQRLPVPDRGVRPTSDRAREALFSSLSSAIPGARVLDLFAGTGALGVEALSRGAAHATFVERHKPTARALEASLVRLGVAEHARVLADDAHAAIARLGSTSFDLVFVDPPYADPITPSLAAALVRVLDDGGRIVVERARAEARPLELPLPLVFDRHYGEAWVRVFEKTSTTNTPDEITGS